jgi:translation initiation factor 2B subunit (eIF-2B alpha/beta/delta family)
MTRDPWEGIHQAASNRLSGAAEIVRRAAEAVAALPTHDVEDAVLALVRGQPAMAPLWRLGSEVLGSDDHVEAARRFAVRVVSERDAIAAEAAALLPDVVVVHSFSGTVIDAVVSARSEAICALSEPGGEGAHSARELGDRGVDARLVSDEDAIGAVPDAGAVLVGADAVGPGGVVNKMGTLRLAEAAREVSTPCYSLAGASKLLGADVPAPRPFERTPLDLFTSVITEEGPLSPTAAARRALEHTLHPLLVPLLQGRM